MWFLLAFASLAALSSAAAETSEPHYVIITPNRMSYPSLEKVCVNFFHLKGPLHLKVQVISEANNQTELLLEDWIDGPDYFHCYPIKVPRPSQKYETWNFQVLAEAENLKINRTKLVLIENKYNSYIIQTDKDLYKPGQTVRFRVVTLNRDFFALDEKLPLVEIIDPNDNRIGQWQDVAPFHGISDFSFPLSEHLSLGKYKINIPNKKSLTFTVAEYVPRKIELNITAPKRVNPRDKSFTLKICGRYTFGKPVQGSLKIYVCEPSIIPLDGDDIDDHGANLKGCQYIDDVQTDNSGCFSREIDLLFFKLRTNSYIKRLTVSSSIKEPKTGLEEKASAEIEVRAWLQMYFQGIEYYYYRGIPYKGVIALTDANKQPRPHETIYLIVNNDDVKTNISLVTNERGVAHFTLDTSEWFNYVQFSGAFDVLDGDDNSDLAEYRLVYPFYSPSKSFLKIEKIFNRGGHLQCDTVKTVKVEYIINKNDLHPESDEISFYYLVSNKHTIRINGEHKLNVRGPSSGPIIQGSFYLNFTVTNDLSTYSTLLVYMITRNGIMVGDYTAYIVNLCFKNKVKLEFSEKEVLPRGKVSLKLMAEPGSMCSLRSVDKGQLLQALERPSKYITEHSSFGYKLEKEEKERACLENDTESRAIVQMHQKDTDMYIFFFFNSLKIFTNARIHRPVLCDDLKVTERSLGGKTSTAKSKMPSDPSEQESKKLMHQLFPVTWVYDLISVGPEGHTTISLTTPDSITTWVADALCVGRSGYGESETAVITTFKPYFVDLTVPYSVVQGEVFPLSALVYNYLKSCVVVSVSLSESPYFSATDGNEKQTQCICAEQSAIFTWNITAPNIGNVKVKVISVGQKLEGACPSHDFVLGVKTIEDSLERTVIVKPSGIREDKTETYRICPAGGLVRHQFSFTIPDNLVAGSERADITVFGDILNNAIVNMNYIFEFPIGCGEQNMAFCAVTIHILQYLNFTGQLTSKEEKKLLKVLSTGYQKQLMFQNENGSYSIFSGQEGNSWLTAFTAKYLSQAQTFIYIDDKNIEGAIKWLSDLQMPDGCFQKYGNYFNNKVEDKNASEITVTAYIVIALMEIGKVKETGLVGNALECLRKGMGNVNNTFSEALLAYAFTLSGDHERRQHVLEDLERKATHTDIYKYWEIENANTGNIELTSYIALALLKQQPVTEDRDELTKIMNWILNKQKPNGGFSSTQDTVVALQAMSEFAKLKTVQEGDVTLTVRSLSGFQKEFFVDKAHSILHQKASLPDIPGEYVVTARGGACVYVQAHLQYYVPVAKTYKNFALSVSTRPIVCTKQALASFEIDMEVRYTGNRHSSNMVMVVVELLSGFVPRKSNIMLRNPHVKKTEITEDKVLIYLSELTHETQRLSFSIKQATRVNNLHPATVWVYDYYEPEERAMVEYTSPCNKE